FTLALTATLAGAVLGVALCAVLNLAHIQAPLALQLFLMREELHLLVKPSALLGAIALIAGCTTGIALFPSFLAARLQPVTAMHRVG
ncbi:MAG TPA: ABC transporter permease, partial [Myxococcaceae bacterium]